MAVTTATPIEAVRRFLDLFESGDFTRMREACDPDIRWLNERTGEWMTGIDALIDYDRAALDGTTELRAELLDPVGYESGDQAAVSGRLVFHGVWNGEPYEVPCPATFVLRRAGDDWKIVYEHALEYRPRESA